MFIRRVFSIGLILFGGAGLYTTYWNLFGFGVIVNAFSGNSSSKSGIYIIGLVSLLAFIYGFYLWGHRFKLPRIRSGRSKGKKKRGKRVHHHGY